MTSVFQTGTMPTEHTAPQLHAAAPMQWRALCTVRISAVRADRKIATEAGAP